MISAIIFPFIFPVSDFWFFTTDFFKNVMYECAFRPDLFCYNQVLPFGVLRIRGRKKHGNNLNKIVRKTLLFINFMLEYYYI